jgi:hypothetical protein
MLIRVLQLTTIILIGLMLGLAESALAASTESQIEKFELTSCHSKKKKCVKVIADKAQSGTISPNLMLSNVSVEIKDQKGKIVQTYKQEKGFYDYEAHRIILSHLTPQNSLKETVILLKELEVQHMEMK